MARFFVLNDTAIRVERIAAHSWELFVEEKRHGAYPTLRQARERAEQIVNGPKYNVDIWNHEGDVVKHFREVTADELDEIREQYEDEPLDVVAEECR